ncbi:nuclear transport factor 2 family protein [Herbihabitans rhizosphaerae]|uniref:nuclear transport factor 2 family protein n=1 Tax=Herbihabitans rhizosphaerae TaxID=1872711 RepID=UPI00102ADD5C|nr:nuclear transport factor 2 family protein [Herbihabitans rhizosphaerae]
MRPPSPASAAPEERYLARWAVAWATGDAERCLAGHAATMAGEHTRYVQPLFHAARGERGLRTVGKLFALIPDLTAEIERWAVADGFAFVEFTLRGHLGGRPVAVRAVDRMTLDGEPLVERENYCDPLPVVLAVLVRPRVWPLLVRHRVRITPRPRR